MHDEGKRAPEIAAALNRTPAAIRSLRGSMGLRAYVQMDDGEKAYMRELHAGGMSDVDIADLTGRVITTVRRVLGIRLAVKRRWTPAETRRLYALRAEGLTYPQVAQVLGRTPHACVMRHLNYVAILERRKAKRRAASRRQFDRIRVTR